LHTFIAYGGCLPTKKGLDRWVAKARENTKNDKNSLNPARFFSTFQQEKN